MRRTRSRQHEPEQRCRDILKHAHPTYITSQVVNIDQETMREEDEGVERQENGREVAKDRSEQSIWESGECRDPRSRERRVKDFRRGREREREMKTEWASLKAR